VDAVAESALGAHQVMVPPMHQAGSLAKAAGDCGTSAFFSAVSLNSSFIQSCGPYGDEERPEHNAEPREGRSPGDYPESHDELCWEVEACRAHLVR